MEIEFVSAQNHMMPGEPEVYLTEMEDREYIGTIKPDGEAYKLILTSKGGTMDENRKFLTEKEFRLEDEAVPGNNLIQFAIVENGKRIGRLYFTYYPNTTYKVFQLCLDFMKSDTVQTDLSLIFKKIRHFTVKL